MAGAKRVRWDCPEGLHAGVLGSTRPPMDSTVRYCLECSAASGRLVKRTAPALERKRAARTAQREVRQERARERAQEARLVGVTNVDGSAGQVDVQLLAREMRKLPELAATRRESKQLWPTVVVRRSKKGHSSGHCKTYGAEVVLTIGAGAVDGHGPSRESVEELVLHELVHAVCDPREWHGRAFRTTLLRAAKEYWPGLVTPRNEGKVYDMDDKIVVAAQELRRKELAG